ncbi:MAG: hypothetical protein H0T85_02025, partial [Geodermatophilaceae bacterium]|nr:hypothetical protein [Geodermatophilaceae bacterium]
MVTATCLGAVLAAAVASSVAWALTPAPTRATLAQVSSELAGDDVVLARVSELYVDSSHLGPREVRGSFENRILLDDLGVEKIVTDARRAGWQTTVFRDPDGTFVRAIRGDLAADVSAAQVDLTTTVPPTVN